MKWQEPPVPLPPQETPIPPHPCLEGQGTPGRRVELLPQAQRELEQLLDADKLKYRESIAQGLENAPKAFISMLKGENFGKQDEIGTCKRRYFSIMSKIWPSARSSRSQWFERFL